MLFRHSDLEGRSASVHTSRLFLPSLALRAKGRHRPVDAAKTAHDLDRDQLQLAMEARCERDRVGWKTWTFPFSLAWPKAAVTVTTHAGTDGPTTSPRDWPEARYPFRHQHTDISPPLALQ
ncbi:MAG: hypothetical protein OEW13_02485, partial [Nitrospira sp.]|nr:hypothetical protein [Nitrospira sp.]